MILIVENERVICFICNRTHYWPPSMALEMVTYLHIYITDAWQLQVGCD